MGCMTGKYAGACPMMSEEDCKWPACEKSPQRNTDNCCYGGEIQVCDCGKQKYCFCFEANTDNCTSPYFAEASIADCDAAQIALWRKELAER